MTLPLTIISQIRDGGTVGSGAWAARILGPGKGKWQFKLTFCDKRSRRSASGKRGRIELHLDRPGIYQLFGVGDFRGAGDWSGFVRIDADGRLEVLGALSTEEVLAAVRLLSEAAALDVVAQANRDLEEGSLDYAEHHAAVLGALKN